MADLWVPGLVHFLCFSGLEWSCSQKRQPNWPVMRMKKPLTEGRLKRRVRRVQDVGRHHLSGAVPGGHDSPVIRSSLNHHCSVTVTV